MTQTIVELQQPPTLNLQTTLEQVGFSVNPETIQGIDQRVERALVDTILMPPLALLVNAGDAKRLKEIALESSRGSTNSSIAEFVEYEHYQYVGEIFMAFEQIDQHETPPTEEEKLIIGDLTNFRISAAIQAIEAAMNFKRSSNPTELWNYFDRILNRLEKQFMRIGHKNKQMANEIVEEITVYKTLQDKLVFE